MANAVDKITDLLLMLGINNLAFLMLLVGALFFVPEPIDAIAAELNDPELTSTCTTQPAQSTQPAQY